jgi:hypothetical protein
MTMSKPGWFPNPSNPNSELYFDGEKWTGESRAVTPFAQSGSTSFAQDGSYANAGISKKKKLIIALASVMSVVILVGGVTTYSIHKKNVEKKAAAALAQLAYEQEKRAEAIRNDITWVPNKYTAWSSDKTIAWKWNNSASSDCYSCHYWNIDIVTKYGCTNGVYGELNIERNGVVVSYANDSLSYLGVGDKGRLTFETYEDGSLQGSLVELRCS